MIRISAPISSSLAALALACIATAQQVVITPEDTTGNLMAFSPIDGSLVNASVFPIPDAAQVTALQVGSEIWIGEQIGDRVVRYDACGNVLGVMGPTLAGGGMDNIRGMSFFGGVIYVTNDGSGNGATADSLVTFDAAGNYLGTIVLSASPSPFSVLPHGGDMLVVSSSGPDRVHRYTLTGTSLGTFNNAAALGFSHAAIYASDGNIWLSTFTTDTIVKLDAVTGAIIQTIAAPRCRGIYELANGNLLYTSLNGTFVYDFGSSTSTLIHAATAYNLRPANLDFACHKPFGAGCHSFTIDHSNLFQFFGDVNLAKAALQGNALRFQLSGNSYVANWLPGGAGGLYLAPSGGATIVANVSTGQETFTPSAPIPVPGGTTATWTVSSEGILTAGSVGNQGTDITPTLVDTASSPGLAFYTWCTQNPTETSSGKVKWEEVGGVLYVTFDGVEFSGGTPTLSPSTFQWQINMATGEVTMLWVTMFGTGNSATTDVLVGCTLAGTGITPVSQTLSTVTNVVLQADEVLLPLTLSASPSPVINPSTNVTYTITNVPETAPGSGLHLSFVFFSVNPLTAATGIDLTGIITSQPGCKLYLGTLDLGLGIAVTATPTNPVPITFSTPTFAPGDVIGAQAVALFDATFPLLNGEASGYVVSNGVFTQVYPQ